MDSNGLVFLLDGNCHWMKLPLYIFLWFQITPWYSLVIYDLNVDLTYLCSSSFCCRGNNPSFYNKITVWLDCLMSFLGDNLLLFMVQCNCGKRVLYPYPAFVCFSTTATFRSWWPSFQVLHFNSFLRNL